MRSTDFTPVALIAEVPIVLIVRKDLPAENLKEFVAYAKANQAKMQFGSAGAGSATHLGCVLLNIVIGHRHHARALPRHRPGDAGPAGRPHRLSVRDRHDRQAADRRRHREGARDHDTKRSPALPNLPTALEQGTPDLEAYTWNAIFLPKDAPAPIVKKLNAAAREAMKTPPVRERLASLGAQVVSDDRTTPEYLAQVRQERDREMGGADQGERRHHRVRLRQVCSHILLVATGPPALAGNNGIER